MFHEYALDPGVLSSWQAVRYFLDALGPWKGRLLAEYPRRWKKMVYEGLSCPDVEKHRIIERLRLLDARVFSPRQNGPYDGLQTWRDNAVREHARAPFRAVIVPSDAKGVFLEADQVTEEHLLWRVEPGRDVAREPVALVQALDLLLKASNHIAIIDPFFRADQSDKLMPLVHLCRAVAGRQVVIDVHASDAQLAHHEFERLARRALPANLPAGISVTLRSWKERPGGKRFHNRYLITNVGGVQFGDSIEAGDRGHSDRLSRLGALERDDHWARFYGGAPAFDLLCEVVITSTA